MELLISWDRGQSTELKVLTEGLRGLVKNAQPTADLQKKRGGWQNRHFTDYRVMGQIPGRKPPRSLHLQARTKIRN